MTAETQSSQRVKPRSSAARFAEKHPGPLDPRAAVLWAAVRLLRESGTQAVTIEAVCALAKQSRSSFYELFVDRTDLLLGIFDDLAERAERMIHTACGGEECWLDGVRAALSEVLLALESAPELARFMLVDSAASDSPLPARRARLLGELARALEAELPRPAGGRTAAPFGAEAVIGAVAAILHGRLLEDPPPRLAELAGPLMGVIVLPYLGAGAAREEVSRPPSGRQGADGEPDAMRNVRGVAARLGVRLTFRTLHTLQAIAAHPDINNSEIARLAGIADAGQTSRLLSRLRGLGAIESTQAREGSRPVKVWRLTSVGHELLQDSAQDPRHDPR